MTFFDGENSFSRTSAQGFIENFIEGTISGDGSSIAYSDFFLRWNDGTDTRFGCETVGCDNTTIFFFDGTITYSTSYSSPTAALASFSATPSTPVPFELNPNSGILILMGLWGTNKVIQRQKKSKN